MIEVLVEYCVVIDVFVFNNLKCVVCVMCEYLDYVLLVLEIICWLCLEYFII